MGNINLRQTTFAGIASALQILYLTGATYDNMQDFINTTMSSGRISGGTIDDDEDGTITVATGTGFIKSSDTSAIEETYFFDWPASTTVPLEDGEVNYIYVEYNAGTPRAWSTTDRSTIRYFDHFTLGRVYKDGNTLHIINSGTNLANHLRLSHERLVACRWLENASGGAVSEPVALKLKTTAGVFYVGQNKITTPEQDTSGVDTFTAWYRDGVGGWSNELAETDVDVEHYDNDDPLGLEDIPANKFSARYVYIDLDGHIFVQYGQQGDKLAIVQAEPVPAPPAFLNEFAILAARVIVKDGTSPLIEIAGAYGDMFQYKGITEHGDLAGVTSDQHHPQGHTLASHSTKAHSELTDVTADQHHAQVHTHVKVDITDTPWAWADVLKVGSNLTDLATRQHVGLTDVTENQHHNKLHSMTGVQHSAAGLTIGHVLRATGAEAFAWAQLQHGDLGGVTSDLHHAQLHAASHANGQGDELSHDALKDFVGAEHLSLPNTIANVLSDHTKAAHDALGIDAATVDGENAADIVTNARVKAHFPDTIANILSNHTLAVHNALNITQLGTVATGVWQGTAIANAYIAGLNQNCLTTSSPAFAGATIPKNFFHRVGGAASGISWYSSDYTAWATYMAQAAQGSCGATANITAPAGTVVTSWALRSFVENNATYGWTWESGLSSGQPSVVAELRASDGLFYPHGGVRIGSYTLTAMAANNKVQDSDKVDNEHASAIVTKARVDGQACDHGALSGRGDDDHSIYYNAARHTKAIHDALLITVLGSGALAKDHGAAATDQIINVCYGTGAPPVANTTTIGTIFIRYTA